MVGHTSEFAPSLASAVEARVRQSTHNRVRNFVVEEVQGRLILSGLVSTQHTKQLALQGALDLLPGNAFDARIVVQV